MSEITIKESKDKITIVLNHVAGIFQPQIEKNKKTNIITARWPYMFFIPTERVVDEPLKEVIGVPVVFRAFGTELARSENRFHIILRFHSKMLMIGAVNFIDVSALDFSVSQIMDRRHRYQNSVSREDIFNIAKILNVKARIVKERPRLGRA